MKPAMIQRTAIILSLTLLIVFLAKSSARSSGPSADSACVDSVYEELPLGAIKPEDWLRHQLEITALAKKIPEWQLADNVTHSPVSDRTKIRIVAFPYLKAKLWRMSNTISMQTFINSNFNTFL